TTLTQITVMEGDSVTLRSNFTDIQMQDQIMWLFGPQETPLAEILLKNVSIFGYENGRFIERILLDPQTGDLTITDTSKVCKAISGIYKLQINSQLSRCNGFSVTVYAHLPVPVITRDSSQCSSSSSSSGSSSVSKCSLLCSVLNVSDVTLSWYKGNSLLSRISVSDLSISLSLPLEVEYMDINPYSCVVSSSFTKQTTHLDISQLCP
ncbi:hypothetical protein QQF64_019418, partial [Cirrhinus molitorella]